MKFNITGEFEHDVIDAEKDQEWFLENILAQLPDGAKAQIKADNFVVNVPDLTDEYVGHWIAVTRENAHNVYGTIEQLFSGSSEYRKVVVIKGQAHELYPYELAVLTPPVSVGIKEADFDEDEFIDPIPAPLTEAEAVLKLSDIAIENSDKVIFAGATITKSFAENALGIGMTSEEFEALQPHLQSAVLEIVKASLMSILRDVYTLTHNN